MFNKLYVDIDLEEILIEQIKDFDMYKKIIKDATGLTGDDLDTFCYGINAELVICLAENNKIYSEYFERFYTISNANCVEFNSVQRSAISKFCELWINTLKSAGFTHEMNYHESIVNSDGMCFEYEQWKNMPFSTGYYYWVI